MKENPVALVTGGNRGIGKELVRQLAKRGAVVLLTARDLKKAEATAAELSFDGAKALARELDVTNANSIHDLADRVERDHGRLDILINNAATNPYFGHVVDTDPSAFQKTVDVNIRGYFFMSARGAKLMARNGGGAIVNVASINGVIPGPMQGIYSISKAAVISMTHSFAAECAPTGVRVNALLPGGTDTRFAAKLVHDPSVRDRLLPHIPMGRFAQPDEMAGAVLYLVSPAASYTTGTCLNVDGGYLVA